MSNDDVSERYRLAIEVCRDGDNSLQSAPIILFDDGTKEIIVGRFEILAAQHRCCTVCPGDISLWSTKGRCTACSLVNQWAVTGLSRRLLRFTVCQETSKVFLQGRGQHAIIEVGSRRVPSGLGDWSDPMEIHVGDRIHLAPTLPKRNEKPLDLVLVPVPENVTTAVQWSQLRPPEAILPASSSGSKIVKQVEPVSPIVAPSVTTEQPIVALSTISSTRKRRIVDTEEGGKDVRLFLVPLGHDMSSIRRKMLADKAERLGARIVEDIFLASHIVVSQQVSTLDEVSSFLGVNSTSLRRHIEENDIPCLLPKWMASKAKDQSLAYVGIYDRWQGDIQKRRTIERRRKQDTDTTAKGERNEAIAEMFRVLANLHQSCPLLESDQWKAYMFRIMAGRLNNLDFEITNNPQTLDRLRQISGFGSNSVDKIKEYLETGTMSRIEEFKSDPKRVAMKNMMDIWGVGRKTALDLLHRGFRNIDDVRTAIQEGGHFLDRNQLVGVDCYEDILEEMDREEVEMIGETVRRNVEEIFPGAQVNIMGSYRRQKATCGDIDVHITHSSYIKKNPELGLSKIVDLLWERGHLVFHLTFLPGMTTGSNVADYTKSSKHIPKMAWQLSKQAGYLSSKGHDGSSYMGVIWSPKIPGKRRRIDIKFYPWRERIFASLYFTGNGYFNRSMRLWASRKFRFTLNDHGLFYIGTQDRVMEASDEKEVFDKLDLVYKEPHERNCFDAVISKQGPIDLQLTQADLREDRDYTWVN